MFSCKNFIVFVELFLYMLGSFVMMVDVLVVCSLHSMVSFCRFLLIIGFLYVSYWCVFPKRSILSWMYFIASCLSQLIQMIGKGSRFTDEENLRTFILFADLETKFVVAFVNIFGFTLIFSG